MLQFFTTLIKICAQYLDPCTKIKENIVAPPPYFVPNKVKLLVSSFVRFQLGRRRDDEGDESAKIFQNLDRDSLHRWLWSAFDMGCHK